MPGSPLLPHTKERRIGVRRHGATYPRVADRSAYHVRVQILTFLFGSGWWIVWHLVIVGSAVPMFFALRSLRRTKPGDGPQGGEALFLLLVGVALGLLAATLVDAGLLGWKLGEIRGAMWGTIVGLVFCTLWTLVLFGVANRLLVPRDDAPVSSTPAVVVFAIWHAGIVAANLVALAKIRG